MAKRTTGQQAIHSRFQLPWRLSTQAAGPAERPRFSPALNLRAALATTALATGVLMGASLWSPHEAEAQSCVDALSIPTPNEVNCDTARTTTDTTQTLGGATNFFNSPIRHWEFTDADDIIVTIDPTGDIDGNGLAVSSTQPGAAIIVDHQGAISVDDTVNPSEGGNGVFKLTTDGGDITYTGNGSVIDNDAGNLGLVIDTGSAVGGDIAIGASGTGVVPTWQGTIGLDTNSGTGDQNVFLDGGTITTAGSAGGDAIRMGSSSGDLNLTLEGGTQLINADGAPGVIYGINANSTSGDITIESDAVIGTDAERFFRGISASTGGAIDITHSGSIFASAFGIRASGTGAAGSVVVTVDGAITSADVGVDASITNAANFDNIIVHQNVDLSAGGTGITATHSGTGSILVDGAGNVTGGTDGIVAAQNNNAAGTFGHVTIAGSGDTEGTAGIGIDARITGASNAGNVTVVRSGAVTGATAGINASTAGTGFVAVTVTDAVTATAGNAIQTAAVDGLNTVDLVAGTVSASGDGVNAASSGSGDILVEMSGGQIGTDVANRVGGNGIQATSTGTGDIDVTATTIFADESGVLATIDNVASGGDVHVTVEENGLLHGGVWAETNGSGDAVVTIGDGAEVHGNSPGSASITAGGDAIQIIGSNVMVTGSSGVVVDQTNPAGTGIASVLVGNDSTIVGDGTDGTDAYNGNGIFAGNQGTGPTSVVTGDGTSVSGTANGIVAFQTNAANANDITISTSGPVTGSGTTAVPASTYTAGFDGEGLPRTGIGIGAWTAGTGDIDISAGGTVSGLNAGIQALASGGAIEISAASTVNSTNGNAIDAITSGAGAVTITTQDAVTGGDNGIRAESDTGNLTITANGPVSGTAGDGIQATSPGGDVTVTAKDAVSGGNDGIEATGSVVVVNSTVSSTGTGGHGINATGDDVTVNASGTTSGGVDGINASGGEITVNASGTTTGGNDGINATSTADNVTITTAGVVTGGDDGIEAAAGGAGAITITTSDAVTGADDGIVTSAADGETLIMAGADVTGGNDGIDATATGTGGITISTVDGTTIAGTADNGIEAQATSGNIVIAAGADITGGTNGILAGTGTGDIAIAGDGDITGTSGSGISAASTGGGSIDVAVSGAASGATGIDLAVVGAGTIDLTTGAVTGTAGDGIHTSAGAGATQITTNGVVSGTEDGIDAQSTGGPISVTANDAVTGGANGILVAAGGGAVDIDAGGPVTGNAGDGIQASGGTVDIDFADNDVTGTDDGIQANATGDITITGSGDVTGGTGDGIIAMSTAGGNVAVDVTGDISGANGIVLSATGAGTIDLATGGLVIGTVGDGINTQAVNGATTIVAKDTVTGQDDGIDATATGTGAITITTSAAVTGVNDDGIDTTAVDGATTITANATVTGDDEGIEAAATGEGDITVNANAAVTGTNDDGIDTEAFNGDTTITANADVTGGEDGIDADATGTGNVTVDVAAGATVRGVAESGVDIDTNTGTGTVNNDGLIEGTVAAITGATNGLIDIFNNAAGTIRNLTGSPGDVAIATEGPTNIQNDGLIVGRINTGAGNDAFTNDGRWNTTGNSDFGGGTNTLINNAWIDVAHDATLAESTTWANLQSFTNASTGVIDMVDDNDPGGTGDTLEIQGTYLAAAGSLVRMDLALTAGHDPQADSDQLILDGTTPGTSTTDFVFNIVSNDPDVIATTRDDGRAVFGGGQLLSDPIVVVKNRGDLQTTTGDNDIPLARSGLVSYDLISTAPGGGDFQVVSRLDEGLAGGILLPVPAVIQAVTFTTQRSPSPVTAACVEPGVKSNAQAGWVRSSGGETRTDTSGRAGGTALETRNDTHHVTVQGGIDGVLCDLDRIGGNLHFGVTGGHTWGSSEQTNLDTSDGVFGTDIDFDSYFVGPYAAYTRGGLAVRGALRFDHLSFELNNPTEGLDAVDVDFDASTVSGSSDVSYQIAFGQFNLTPEVGLNVSRTDVDKFDIAGGTVDQDDIWSVMGHAGLTGSTTLEWIPGDVYLTPFASGTIYNEFVETADATFNLGGGDIDVTSDRVGTFGQFGLGVNVIKLGSVAAGRPTIFGGARADLQYGDDVQGFTAMAFGRVQF